MGSWVTRGWLGGGWVRAMASWLLSRRLSDPADRESESEPGFGRVGVLCWVGGLFFWGGVFCVVLRVVWPLLFCVGLFRGDAWLCAGGELFWGGLMLCWGAGLFLGGELLGGEGLLRGGLLLGVMLCAGGLLLAGAVLCGGQLCSRALVLGGSGMPACTDKDKPAKAASTGAKA
jgi:hypothetical protein